MPKSFSPPTIEKKRIALRIPKNMYSSIISLLLKTGKSTRYFSYWISEAIINLSDDENYTEIIKEELLDRGENISKQISLTPKANEMLNFMKEHFIKKYNLRSDINSKIIRTAITQQLIKEEILMK